MTTASPDWHWPIDQIATWNRIDACAATGHAPFYASGPRPWEDTCICGAIVRTVSTPESDGEAIAERRKEDRDYEAAQLRAQREDARW